MSETVASARILDRPSSGGWDILEPDYCDSSIKPKDGLLVGRTLVNLSAEKVLVHLMNLTTQSKRIKKGTEVAICSTVESVLVQNNLGNVLVRFQCPLLGVILSTRGLVSVWQLV